MNRKNKSNKKNIKKKNDGEFHSKHIKHSPQDESARAVFGRQDKE